VIVTDEFVFLHLHKSGGTFVNDFIERFFPSALRIGYHLPGAYIPGPYRHLPVFGFVRNPWSYYASWYTFQAGMQTPNPFFRVLSDQGRLGFNDTIRNLLDLSNDREKLQSIAAGLPDEFSNAGINITKRCMQGFEGSGIGFYSFLYDRMFGGVENISIGKMESMRRDLAALLLSAGIQPSPEMERHIQSAPKLNITKHRENSALYDSATRDLVLARDAAVIERHGYAF